MKNFVIATGAGAALAAAALGLAGAAFAAPTGPGVAADTVEMLQDQGYNVQINGSQTAPLSMCAVTGVHNPAGPGAVTKFTTVYVDVSCPTDFNS